LKILVIKNSTLIGSLLEDKNGISFEYSPEVSKSDYLIGIKEIKSLSKELFPVFENLLPEHEQLELIKTKYQIKGTIGSLLYLDNIHGSFEFYTEENFKEYSSVSNEVFNFLDVRECILEQDYSFPNILDDYTLDIDKHKILPIGLHGSKAIGISGYQYKFSISIDKDTKIISHNENENGDYIMKPYNADNLKYSKDASSSYIPHLLVNEHIFMTFARDLGFSIPYNGIIKYGDDYLYVIKRFDRYNDSKIDHHEILTLIGKKSSEKYNITTVEAMEEAAQYLSQDEMAELFKFFVFSIIIAHGDLHAKNISLIYKSNALSEKNMTLSPYYDISTVRFYKDITPNDIGMTVKNKKSKIKEEDLLWLANKFQIQEEMAKGYIEDIGLKFINTFETYIDKLPREIKALKITTNNYGYSKPFEETLRTYYRQRVEYLCKYMNIAPIEVTTSIWE